jgi:hypothetical protein
VAPAREHDRLDASELVHHLRGERLRVDHDRAVAGRERIRGAEEVDPLVVDGPAPDAGQHLLDRVGRGARLAHRAADGISRCAAEE